MLRTCMYIPFNHYRKVENGLEKKLFVIKIWEFFSLFIYWNEKIGIEEFVHFKTFVILFVMIKKII